MMKSTLKFYNVSSRFNESKNFMFDDIEAYVGNSALTINNFQYTEPNSQLSIVIHHAENYISRAHDFLYTYMSITNYNEDSDDEITFYYFIDSTTWVSSVSLQLNLTLDVLNSFKPSFNNIADEIDYAVSKRSKVARRHKDRYISKITPKVQRLITTNRISYDGTYSYFRIRAYIGNHKPIVSSITPSAVLYDSVEYIELLNDYYINLKVEDDLPALIISRIEYYFYLLVNKIDFLSEGTAPIKYKKREAIINDVKDDTNSHWYLIYRNREEIGVQVNPVECYIISDNPIRISYLGNGTIEPSDVSSSTYAYLFRSNLDNSNYTVNMKATIGGDLVTKYSVNIKPLQYIGKETVLVIGTPIAMDTYQEEMLSFKKITHEGVNKFNCQRLTYKYSLLGTTKYNESFTVTKEYLYIEEFEVVGITSNTFDLKYSSNGSISSLDNFTGTETISFAFTPTISDQLKTIADVDRTDEKLIKILALPYMPFEEEVQYNASTGYFINIPPNCEYDSTYNALKVTSLSTKLFNQIETPNSSQAYGFIDNKSVYRYDIPTYELKMNRTKIDPKLLHSDFYYQKVVYDTFNYMFKFEEYDSSSFFDDGGTQKSYYNFNVSKNSSGRFMMSFPSWKPNRAQLDYDSIMIINRNNEITLFNNAYLTYLRTAYNYDVKAKNRQQISSILSIGQNLSRILNPTDMSSLIGGAPGVITGTVNSIMAMNQAEDSLSAKMKQLEYQASNIINADDIDLLEAYSENKFKLEEYEVDEEMKKSLDDMFYYFGYISVENFKNEMMNSRVWFNYIQGEFELEKYSGLMKDEWINSIIEKFKNGVTYLHGNVVNGNVEYDVRQILENWESSVRDIEGDEE